MWEVTAGLGVGGHSDTAGFCVAGHIDTAGLGGVGHSWFRCGRSQLV